MGEVLTVLPFQNTLATFQISGKDLVAALENGVSQIEDGAGRFPQVAGLKYSFRQVGASRTRAASSPSRSMEDGAWTPIDPAKDLSGRHQQLRPPRRRRLQAVRRQRPRTPMITAPGLEQVVADYLAAHRPYTAKLDGRITEIAAAAATPAAGDSAGSAAPVPAAGKAGSGADHVIAAGDTFWALAEQAYGSGAKWKAIADANPAFRPRHLPVGATLKMPPASDGATAALSDPAFRRTRRDGKRPSAALPLPAARLGSATSSHGAMMSLQLDAVRANATGPLPAGHPPVKPGRIGVLLVNLGTPDGTDYLADVALSARIPLRSARHRAQQGGLVSDPLRPGADHAAAEVRRQLRQDLEPQRERIAAAHLHPRPGRQAWLRRLAGTRRDPSSTGRCATAIRRSDERRPAPGEPTAATASSSFPLYPQYSATTTATANDQLFRALMSMRRQPARPQRAALLRRAGLYRGAGALDRAASGDARLRAGGRHRLLSRHPASLFRAGRPLSLPLPEDDAAAARTARLEREAS